LRNPRHRDVAKRGEDHRGLSDIPARMYEESWTLNVFPKVVEHKSASSDGERMNNNHAPAKHGAAPFREQWPLILPGCLPWPFILRAASAAGIIFRQITYS
jgi:hypothetical protein